MTDEKSEQVQEQSKEEIEQPDGETTDHHSEGELNESDLDQVSGGMQDAQNNPNYWPWIKS